jgi:hypothetical protein
LTQTCADEPRPRTSGLARRQHTIELSLVLPNSSGVVTEPSCSKAPEPKSGGRQVIKVILNNYEKERITRVLLDCGIKITILNKKWAYEIRFQPSQELSPKGVGNFPGKIDPRNRTCVDLPQDD